MSPSEGAAPTPANCISELMQMHAHLLPPAAKKRLILHTVRTAYLPTGQQTARSHVLERTSLLSSVRLQTSEITIPSFACIAEVQPKAEYGVILTFAWR